MNKKEREVKSFWQDQAATFKGSQLATAPDQYYRELEIREINNRLADGKRILDVGCGNGYSTIRFARKYKKANFIGVDYSEEMIKYAELNLKKESPSVRKRVRFLVGDVRSLSKHPELQGKKFDYVVSERCLINLLDWNEQKNSLLDLKRLLRPKGIIVLCENTQEGLQRLNVLRKKFSLPEIKVRWHNYYMPEKKLLDLSRKRFSLIEATNIGSTYYLISRVAYAAFATLEKKQPDYMHPLNKIAKDLPIIGDFSPNFIFMLRNK